jgi:CRP-like cAMP-binding protein
MLRRRSEHGSSSRKTAATRRFDGIELFNGCRRRELQRIDPLGTTVVVRPFRGLCYGGEIGSQFFVLVDGTAEVESAEGRLALMHSGAWFGETELIHNTPCTASVRTLVESTLIVFSRREFNTLRRELPQVRDCLDATAALLVNGEQSRPWYQPVKASVAERDAVSAR